MMKEVRTGMMQKWTSIFQLNNDFWPLLVLHSQNKKLNLTGQAAVVYIEPAEVQPTAKTNEIEKQ